MCVRLLSVAATLTFFLLVVPTRFTTAEEKPQVGPETEKRFPPLQLPDGFKATLFASDSLVEYPSVIALGPKPGTLFVAHDYMTGLGREIIRRDEVRLLQDTNGDGYADKSTIYAGKFNSIQGLEYHDGTVFVMHAPILTALRDTNGDGVADWRRDLLFGLGLTPEKNTNRLHCANGVVAGHDGWLYLAMGDNGCDVLRPEGDRFVFHGGGILRCRRDGRDLHLFAKGTRNIYDVALDDELNVFIRDNENDGGDFMIRVCHSFHGADHGYPYLYRDRPDEAMLPLADLGRGSSAGGVCYLENAFPPAYRGNLIFCEWGRAVVRYDRKRAGGGFAQTKEIDVAAGAENDPYGLKPTDVVVDRDGSLLFSDWGDGQRPKRGRGRIYRITYHGNVNRDATPEPKDVVLRLNSKSYRTRLAAQLALQHQRDDGLKRVKQAMKESRLGELGRMHAVWLLANVKGKDSIETLFRVAKSDRDLAVRAQAIRAIADLTDPVLVKHRLVAGRGNEKTAARLAELAVGQDPRIVLEAIIALGRLKWSKAPDWLSKHLKKIDSAVSHAAQQTLRRADNWPAVLRMLDEPADSPARNAALRAVAEQWNEAVVDGLINRLQREEKPLRRQQYADLLSRVYKKPAPWTYWGYRPAPRLANSVTWQQTEAIQQTLNSTLSDTDHAVRLVALKQMQREKIPIQLSKLTNWLKVERKADRVAAILQSLQEHPAEKINELLESVIRQENHATENRFEALAIRQRSIKATDAEQLLRLAMAVEDGPVLAALLKRLRNYPQLDIRAMSMGKLKSRSVEVRVAAIESLAVLKVRAADESIRLLLKDKDARVRRAAASAMGTLQVNQSIDALLKLSKDEDAKVRSASLESLRLLHSPVAVPLAVEALQNRETKQAALAYLAEYGSHRQAAAVADVVAKDHSAETLAGVVFALTTWLDKQPRLSPTWKKLQSNLADVGGNSGVLLHWMAAGPLSESQANTAIENLNRLQRSDFPMPKPIAWKSKLGKGDDGRIALNAAKENDKVVYLGFTDIAITKPTSAQFFASSNTTLQVWLNGRSIYRRDKIGTYSPSSDRFEGALEAGTNRLVVKLVATAKPSEFHVRFRRKSSVAERERLVQLALTGRGNAERGRELFYNVEKSQCAKCHRIGPEGGKIGPDLTGVGSRFSRMHLIESILEPSRTIAPSYEPLAVALDDGRVLSGVVVAKTETTLTIGDNQGKTLVIEKADIEQQRILPQSIMPEGLEKQLSDRQFLDLLSFLLSQKKKQAP